MKKSIAEYVLSKEFEEKVKRVSSQSRPFDNSSSSAEVYEALACASKKSTKRQTNNA